MSTTLTRASVVETTLGIEFAIAELSTQTVGAVTVTNRTVPTYTITTSASASSGAGTIAVNATTVDLDAGTKLTFTGGTVAQVSVFTPSGATSIPVINLTGAIGSGATATTKALRYVTGCYNATVKPDIKNVDTTNYLSGVGKEMLTTGNAKTMSLEFNLVYGDKGGEILRKIAYDKDYIGREFYFVLTFPSGESHEGVALLTSATPTQAVQDKRSFQCEAQIQGDSYDYNAATAYTAT